MLEYPYRKISQDIEVPQAPCILVKLVNNEVNPAKEIECDALFDTGSDLTLIPLDWLVKIDKRPDGTGRRIEGVVKGTTILAIPYTVFLVFDSDRSVEIEAMGCAVSEIGELMIIGRDFMNQYCITFDGPNLKFGIDFGLDAASDRS